MSWRPFWETFVTLFVILDPIGMAPIFVALTADKPLRARRLAALEAAGTAGLVIAVFALFGQLLLSYLNISVESLTIAGGLLLMLVALEMFQGTQDASATTSNIALVPLATPLLAGPGSIATVIVLAQRYASIGGRASVILGIVAAIVVTALGLLVAERVSRILRPASVQLLTRILGLLLAAIAVQLVIDALRALVQGGFLNPQ
jgi:multiple antibiotic resistance protein